MIYEYILLDFFGLFTCFIASTVGREAIVNGDVAQSLQFPYQVSVLISGLGLCCGGGIINNNSIITAASCIMGPNDKELLSNDISILAGTSDLHKTSKETVTVRITTVYVPREYNHGVIGTTGDIAILKTNDYLDVWRPSDLKSLMLPKRHGGSYAGQLAMIAGFGWHWVRVNFSNQTGGRYDTRLRFAEAEILSQSLCEQNHPNMGITEKHLCARVVQQAHVGSRGVCVGDGGGPLVYNGMVIGIFSLGPRGCSERTYPAIYTRVSHYLQFIYHAKTGSESMHLHKINVS